MDIPREPAHAKREQVFDSTGGNGLNTGPIGAQPDTGDPQRNSVGQSGAADDHDHENWSSPSTPSENSS